MTGRTSPIARLAPLVRRLRPLFLALALLEAAFIWWSSGRTWEEELPALALDWGNFLHFPLYGVLGLLIHLGRDGVRPGGRSPWPPALLAALFGLADELHQATVPGRTCSLFDLVTDLSGALFAIVLADRLLLGAERRSRWPLALLATLGLGLASSFLPEILAGN